MTFGYFRSSFSFVYFRSLCVSTYTGQFNMQASSSQSWPVVRPGHGHAKAKADHHDRCQISSVFKRQLTIAHNVRSGRVDNDRHFPPHHIRACHELMQRQFGTFHSARSALRSSGQRRPRSSPIHRGETPRVKQISYSSQRMRIHRCPQRASLNTFLNRSTNFVLIITESNGSYKLETFALEGAHDKQTQ